MIILVLSFAVFLFIFSAMMVVGPPSHLYCNYREVHSWGKWVDFDSMTQERYCKKCGYKEQRFIYGRKKV